MNKRERERMDDLLLWIHVWASFAPPLSHNNPVSLPSLTRCVDNAVAVLLEIISLYGGWPNSLMYRLGLNDYEDVKVVLSLQDDEL